MERIFIFNQPTLTAWSSLNLMGQIQYKPDLRLIKESREETFSNFNASK